MMSVGTILHIYPGLVYYKDPNCTVCSGIKIRQKQMEATDPILERFPFLSLLSFIFVLSSQEFFHSPGYPRNHFLYQDGLKFRGMPDPDNQSSEILSVHSCCHHYHSTLEKAFMMEILLTSENKNCNNNFTLHT